MAKQFNPYQAWLGVRPNTKPSYYELLGLKNFESEPPVLAEAADRAIEMVEVHRSGEHREIAEKVLHELQGIKAVLLTPAKRQAYDEKLRGPAPTPAVPTGPVTLPPSVAATDSPTMMLPPGSLPPPSVPLHPGMAGPAGLVAPPFAPPGHPSPMAAGMPPPGIPYAHAPVYGAAAPLPGMPPTALPPGVLPSAAPYGAAPPFAPPTAQPPSAGPIPGAYSYGPPPEHAGAFGGPTAIAGAPPSAGPAVAGFSPKQSSAPMRRVSQRKQQNSSIMVGIGVLGGAVALLVVAMIIAEKNNSPRQAALDLPPPQAVVPPNPAVEATAAPAAPPTVAQPGTSELDRSFPDGGSIRRSATGGLPVTDVPVTVDVSAEMSPRERRIQERLRMENLIPSLIPEGAKPQPGMALPTGDAASTVPTPTATATAPAPGTPPSPAPTAVAMATAGAPKPAVALPTPAAERPQMEAVLPADAARAKTVQTMFKAAVAAWKARDYSKAEEIVLQTQVLADAPEVINQTLDYGRAAELLHLFWNGVRDGVKSLKPGDVVDFNGKSAKVIRSDEAALVVEQNGNELPLLVTRFVPGLAVQMARRALPDDTNSKLAVGLFLGLDQAGDKAEARKLLGEAGAEGAPFLPIVEQP